MLNKLQLVCWFGDLADADQLVAVDRECYPVSLSLKQWRKLLVRKTAVILVLGLEESRKVIGFCVVDCRPNQPVELLRLAITKEYRNKRLGSFLVDLIGEDVDLVATLREDNKGGLQFAKGVGFLAVAIDKGEFGNCDGIVLERTARTVKQKPERGL